MNIKSLFSKSTQSINPYQWEDVSMQNSLRFDSNTLPFAPPCMDSFLTSMKAYCPINEYTDPTYNRLKELLSGYEKVQKSMITVTNSADEAIDILAKSFLNPGDNFVTTPPTYEMYSIQCGVNKGVNLEVPLGNNFEVNSEEVICVSRNPLTKLIFLVNPNNPTGSVISQKELEKIIKKSEAVVVVDEVYREFYGKSSVSLLKKYPNLVILRSFSKFAALAGARIGYLLADKLISKKFDAIRFPMGVSYLSYKLAEMVLEKDGKWIKEQIKMIKSERERLSTMLTNLGFLVYPSFANFLLVKVGNNTRNLCIMLKEKGIIVRDRSKKKYLQGCIRITIRSPKENNLLIKRIKEII